MIENIVAEGVTLHLQTPVVLQLQVDVVGQIVHVHSKVRLLWRLNLNMVLYPFRTCSATLHLTLKQSLLNQMS